MEKIDSNTLRELFTNALCLDITIATIRQNPPRARAEPARYINDISTPPPKRPAVSTPPPKRPVVSTPFSPASQRLLESFSPDTQTKLEKDFIEDDNEIKRITRNSELDDPNYVNFNSNPKIGTDLEFWVCVNIVCPGCKQKLYKYSCLLYTSPSPRDRQKSRMPSSA